MTRHRWLPGFLILAVASSCATAGRGARPASVRPADEPMAADTSLSAGPAAQSAYAAAFDRLKRGDAAREAGDADRARTEWTAAAEGLLAAEKAGAGAWRLALTYRAAELLGRAGEFDRTAALATRVAKDPAADDRSRALAWHLAAQGFVNSASAQARAGKIAPIKLAFAEERGAPPASPQPIPGPWKSFVEAVDAYVKVHQADPELALPASKQTLPSPGRLAVGAAKVSFTFDDLADARRRLEDALARWPDDAEAVSEGLSPYLQTFLVTGDRAGYQAGVERLRQLIDSRSAKAEGKAKEGFVRARQELDRAVSGAALLAAQRLLDAGKSAEAAQAFEALAADPASPDAANALHNAAIAWDRAGDSTRAVAARERIVAQHADSRVAPSAMLTLAAFRARQGDHAAAARSYGEFIQRWPDHANRCIAMQNVASELDGARRPAEAAERYLAFGRDAGCSRANPAAATIALRRSWLLFDQVGKPARAREAAAAVDELARKPKEK